MTTDREWGDRASDIARIEAALDAAAAVLEDFTPGRIDATFKSGDDPLTEADLAVDHALREHLPLAGEGWLSEETGDSHERLQRSRVWVVDPIDGTNNFIHGLPFYNISIAYREKGATKYGVVYAPALGDMYYSEAGQGSFKNNSRLKVSNNKRLDKCIGISGFPALRAGIKPNNVDLFPLIILKLQSVRIHGASALDFCFVAEGRCDLLWYFNPNPWDTAAGELILAEAGGKVSDFQGGREHELKKQIAGSNGFVHDEFISLLESCSGAY